MSVGSVPSAGPVSCITTTTAACAPPLILKSLVVSFFFSLSLLLFLLFFIFFLLLLPLLFLFISSSLACSVLPGLFYTLLYIYPAFSLSQDADCRRCREFYCPGVRQRCNAAKNVAEPGAGERGGREEDARHDISVNASRWNKRLEYRLVRVSLEKALERSRSSIVRRARPPLSLLFPRYYRSAPLCPHTNGSHPRLRILSRSDVNIATSCLVPGVS